MHDTNKELIMHRPRSLRVAFWIFCSFFQLSGSLSATRHQLLYYNVHFLSLWSRRHQDVIIYASYSGQVICRKVFLIVIKLKRLKRRKLTMFAVANKNINHKYQNHKSFKMMQNMLLQRNFIYPTKIPLSSCHTINSINYRFAIKK